MVRYVWSLLIFGASPERNRDYYLNQVALLFLLYLAVRLMPQSIFNPTDCQMFTLVQMHLTYSRMLSYSITCMLIPLVLTIYLNLMLLCLKCSKIFAYNFPLPGPSYSPILAWSLAILDGVLHKYITWVNIPLLSEFLSWACPEFSRRSEYERV